MIATFLTHYCDDVGATKAKFLVHNKPLDKDLKNPHIFLRTLKGDKPLKHQWRHSLQSQNQTPHEEEITAPYGSQSM